MIDPSAPPDDSYSPQLRTALVLTGIGTAGAYHAGVLRALHEAGVKLDVVAGRGIGAVGALFAAIDGAQRLWEERGFWRSPGVRSFYSWRPVVRMAAWAAALSLAIVALPIAVIAIGLVVFPVDFVLKMVGTTGAPEIVGAYLRLAQSAFAPEGLPTWLPRLVVLVLGCVVACAASSGLRNGGVRRRRGRFWWRVVGSPLSSAEVTDHCWRVMWDLMRGAAQLKQPAPSDLGRRYTEMLTENLGQPGFRELVLTVHDVDAHRDLVFALVAEPHRRGLFNRATTAAAGARRADVLDLSGVARDHVVDAIAGALAIPIATDLHALTFAPDGFWRGETHRIGDRPASLARLLEELSALGVEQAIVVSAASDLPGPHALSAPRLDGRGRVGEYLQSSEMAAVRDVMHLAVAHVPRLFPITPDHNPVGPFDFAGGFDDRSDRRQPLTELMARGYEDAYRQFIEPVVGASGEQVATAGHADAGGHVRAGARARGAGAASASGSLESLGVADTEAGTYRAAAPGVEAPARVSRPPAPRG